MRFSELKGHLTDAVNGAGFAAAYLLLGEDDYLIGEAERLFGLVLDPEFADMNFSRAESVDEAIETLYTFPAFDMRRVCVVSLEKTTADDLEKLKKYLAAPAEESILVAEADAQAKAALKAKNVAEVSCASLSEDETRAYIRALFAEAPVVTVSADAVDELITRTQSSLARIVSEVKKLKAYSPSGVKKEDVEAMVASDIEYQTYLLSEAVSSRDAQKTTRMLDVILKSGVPPRVLLGSLYERFRRLLHVSLNKDRDNEELARYFGFKKPGQVYYLRKNAENFSQVRLKSIVDFLHELQYETVQGLRSEESALHEAVLVMLTA